MLNAVCAMAGIAFLTAGTAFALYRMKALHDASETRRVDRQQQILQRKWGLRG